MASILPKTQTSPSSATGNRQQATTTMAQHIDNFDPFTFDDDGIEEEKADKAFGDNIPWADSSWLNGSSSKEDIAKNHENIFPFSAETVKDHPVPIQQHQEIEDEDAKDLFPSDPMANVSGNDLPVASSSATASAADEPTVRIHVREQFSTLYNDEGSPPESTLQGGIHVSNLLLSDLNGRRIIWN
jgi:hypothetical protein